MPAKCAARISVDHLSPSITVSDGANPQLRMVFVSLVDKGL